MVKVFHGAGKNYLRKLHPAVPYSGGQGGNPIRALKFGLYVSTEFAVAEAFAFLDARSAQLFERVKRDPNRILCSLFGAPTQYVPLAEDTVSYVYESACPESDLQVDPDFSSWESSKRVAHPLPVKAVYPGSIVTWRQCEKILGPHKLVNEDGDSAFTSEGFIQLLPHWAQWNYSQEQLNVLGKWLPFEAVRENKQTKKLYLTSEDALIGAPSEQIPLEDVTEDILSEWYPIKLS